MNDGDKIACAWFLQELDRLEKDNERGGALEIAKKVFGGDQNTQLASAIHIYELCRQQGWLEGACDGSGLHITDAGRAFVKTVDPPSQ
jgi:hypothetical protein